MVHCVLVGERPLVFSAWSPGQRADRITGHTHIPFKPYPEVFIRFLRATDGGTDRSYVFANARRLTAVGLEIS